jgi:hypothetical protein
MLTLCHNRKEESKDYLPHEQATAAALCMCSLCVGEDKLFSALLAIDTVPAKTLF